MNFLIKFTVASKTSWVCLWFFLFFLSVLRPVAATAQQKDSTVTVAAGPHYIKNAFHRFWWGRHYRQVWAEPVAAPFFWVEKFKGGVTPIKQGGSFQTKNLRLQDSVGREFVLRSIDKDPSKALPKGLQKTFVANLMRDQTSVIHPYGAFIVPHLANAAGVYHTNPALVFIPDDPALGEFRAEFANTLALVEERPDGNWEKKASFGNPAEVVSSKKAFEKLMEDPNHQVEARRYLTSRLFDMWLSDWSRREDQWRWGVHEKEGKTTYGAIPRDRDHAFFKFHDGVLTAFVSLFKPNYQSFDKTISKANVKGLINASKRMDAYFLAYLTREDFQQIAQDLQVKLADTVIENALLNWPPQIRKLTAKQFTAKLKTRRDQLARAADLFYLQLNKEVLLPGTDEKDKFLVQYLENGDVTVQLWTSPKKDPPTLVHQKTFKAGVTKSIELFGLGKADELEISGTGPNKMDITWVGGEGSDVLKIPENWKGGAKLLVLDEKDGNEYPRHKAVKVREHSPKANEFNGEGWLLRHRLH
ncbi:hypothetical protein [Rufibacter sp. LB8]|uniref:hypothetical protein n=1 Tax=Rufibacter sp. LB8 TaxID=2777781 RepID=UPI00178C52A9|nr:hypothetical protein [Rufibacter sp. LB8]